jgi:hypothetical protein
MTDEPKACLQRHTKIVVVIIGLMLLVVGGPIWYFETRAEASVKAVAEATAAYQKTTDEAIRGLDIRMRASELDRVGLNATMKSIHESQKRVEDLMTEHILGSAPKKGVLGPKDTPN